MFVYKIIKMFFTNTNPQKTGHVRKLLVTLPCLSCSAFKFVSVLYFFSCDGLERRMSIISIRLGCILANLSVIASTGSLMLRCVLSTASPLSLSYAIVLRK